MDVTAAERLIQPEATRPGWLVRTLGTVVPGVRRTGEQIEVFAAEWHRRNLAALQSGRPLLVALGDSLAQGIGASSIDHGYVGRLATEFANEVAVVNLSRSGAKIPDVLDRQLRILGDLRLRDLGIEPVAITCTVGNNDLLRGGKLSTLNQNMRRSDGDVAADGDRRNAARPGLADGSPTQRSRTNRSCGAWACAGRCVR